MAACSSVAVPAKRQRKDFSELELGVLEAAWLKGMTSTRKECQPKILEVATQLETTSERIQAWIGNKRSKMKNTNSTFKQYQRDRKRVYKSGPNAYAMFVSTQKRGSKDKKEFFKETSEAWRNLDEHTKKQLTEEAEKIRHKPHEKADIKEVVKQQMRIISDASAVLNSVGYHFGGIGMDANGSSVIAVGTEKALNFFTPVSIENDLRTFLNITGQHTVASAKTMKNDDELVKLRQQVRHKFNECWEKITGIKSLPYALVRNQHVQVTLLGCEGVTFKEPSWYGKKDLRYLLSQLKAFDVQYPTTTTVPSSAELETRKCSEVLETAESVYNSDNVISQFAEHEDSNVSGMLENIFSEVEQSSGLEAVTELEAEQRLTDVMVENLKDLQMYAKDKKDVTQMKLGPNKKKKQKLTGKM